MTQYRKSVLKASTSFAMLYIASLSGTAAAQESGTQIASADDVIIVTGSRIVRPDLTATSPVTVISGEQFKQINSTSAEDLLSQNPQFLPEATATVNNGNPGAATINLRGLGDVRTLVLVDGKRMVGYDYDGVVDVNTIPVALIKRVDVLTGGASAVYGSDAVAGVVNFVLDDEFTGLQIDASEQITTRKDANVADISLTGGLASDRGNLVVSVGYTKRKKVFQSARGFSAFALSSDDLVSPGGSSTAVPTVFDNTFTSTDDSYYQIGAGDNLVPFYEPYNYAPPNYLVVPQERFTATLLGKYEISDGVEAYVRGNFIDSKVDSQSAPTGTFGYDFNIFPTNPFLTDQQRGLFFGPGATLNPDGSTTLYIRRRITESGGRTTTFDSKAYQALGGLRGDIGGLNYDVFAQYAETKREIAYLNDITYARVAQALDAVQTANGIQCRDTSNGCVPVNLFTLNPIGTDALDFITAQGAQTDSTKQFVAGASLAGDVGNLTSPLASNPVAFAVGTEYRRESAETAVDAAYGSGDLIGYGQGQAFPSFHYDVIEAYAELQAPLIQDRPFIQSLNLELGYRYSDYSHAGEAHTYKVGGDYTPFDGIRFRGMYQRAVRAPNLYEISAPVISSIDNLDTDPCAGSNPVGNAELTALCIATGAPAGQIGRIAGPVSGQINAFSGGNPDLDVEKADTFTVGVVLQPRFIPGLSASVDYYNIRIKNAIDVLGGSPQNVVDGCYDGGDVSSLFCQAIVRNPGTGSLSGGISYGVYQLQANSVQLSTRGIDVGVDYSRNIGALKVGFAINGTFVESYDKSGTQCAGKFGFACNQAPLPKWKHVASATIGNDWVSLLTRWRFIGAVRQDESTNILASRIGSYSYFDATVSFNVQDQFTFRVGAENILDKQPPLVGADAGGTAYNAANTFPTVYDPLGATLFFGVTAKF